MVHWGEVFKPKKRAAKVVIISTPGGHKGWVYEMWKNAVSGTKPETVSMSSKSGIKGTHPKFVVIDEHVPREE